ncbi:MAG: SAM-dependent methyltransferase [Deltaproteobacteria bacterium]|nr:SAM-dependent methyltransferase [Deltaproteobacteria bacterium]
MDHGDMNPGKFMGIAMAFWHAFTVHAAVKLDVFTVMGGDRLSGQEAAGRLGGDVRGVTTLLNALTALGLLHKKDDTFENTPFSLSYLSKESPGYLGHIVMHMYHLVESWHRLDQAVLNGRPTRPRAIVRSEEEREAFLMGMFNIAMGTAPGAVKEIDLSGRKQLLDLGGGPGTWAIHFCLENPGLRATIYDLPGTRPFAEKTIARFGVSDRVAFQAGNYLEDRIEGQYDAVWLSQVLHGEGPDACRAMIRKAVSILEPGGIILVHEFVLNNDMAGPLHPALFSLNMLAGTREGRAYSEQQIMDMLLEAGAREVRRLPFHSPNESGIVAGTV